MKKVAAAILTLASMAVLAAAQAVPADSSKIVAPNLPKYFDESYNGRSVAIPANSVVEIRLEENSSTGFMWMVGQFDSTLFQLVSDVYVPTEVTGPHMNGSGGTRVFRFKCLRMGAGNIKLVYNRPWWENVNPMKTYNIALNVVVF